MNENNEKKTYTSLNSIGIDSLEPWQDIKEDIPDLITDVKQELFDEDNSKIKHEFVPKSDNECTFSKLVPEPNVKTENIKEEVQQNIMDEWCMTEENIDVKDTNFIDTPKTEEIIIEEIDIKSERSEGNSETEESNLPNSTYPFDNRQYCCKECEYKTHKKANFNRHLARHGILPTEKMYQCSECSYQTNHTGYLKRHALSHEDRETDELFQCMHCDYNTKLRRNFRRHLNSHKFSPEINLHKCPVCPFKTRRIRNLIKMHMPRHINVKEPVILKCDICQYRAINVENLKGHVQQRHSGANMITILKCPHCSYQTERACNFKRHVLRHKNEKKVTMYKCKECDFQSERKAFIYAHARQEHPGAHKCPHCEYRSYLQCTLNKHILLHERFGVTNEESVNND